MNKKKKTYIKPSIEKVIIMPGEVMLNGMSKYKMDSKNNVIHLQDQDRPIVGPSTRRYDISVDGGDLDGSKVNPWGSWDE